MEAPPTNWLVSNLIPSIWHRNEVISRGGREYVSKRPSSAPVLSIFLQTCSPTVDLSDQHPVFLRPSGIRSTVSQTFSVSISIYYRQGFKCIPVWVTLALNSNFVHRRWSSNLNKKYMYWNSITTVMYLQVPQTGLWWREFTSLLPIPLLPQCVHP